MFFQSRLAYPASIPYLRWQFCQDRFLVHYRIWVSMLIIFLVQVNSSLLYFTLTSTPPEPFAFQSWMKKKHGALRLQSRRFSSESKTCSMTPTPNPLRRLKLTTSSKKIAPLMKRKCVKLSARTQHPKPHREAQELRVLLLISQQWFTICIILKRYHCVSGVRRD